MPVPWRPSRELEGLTGGDAHLLAHDVDAGDQLRHRVLDLQPAVHLDEVKPAVGPEQELEGSRISVADRRARALDCALHRLSHVGGERRRRRLLDQLLVPTLDRALPLAEGEDAARRIAEHLDLDMPRWCERLLQIERAVTEGCLRLRARRRERAFQLVFGDDQSHPLAASTGRGLHEDGKSEQARGGSELGEARDSLRSRHQRHARRAHLGLGEDLVAHPFHDLGGRSDEDQVRLLAGSHEGRVLREKAVPRMNRLAARRLGGRDDVRDPEVALGRSRWADANCAICKLDVEGIAVGGRVHGDRFDPELVQGTDDPHGDLAPVRYEDAREHCDAPYSTGGASAGSISNSSCPYSTGWAFSTWMDATIPATSALSSLKSFMASSTHSVCPGTTVSPMSTNAGAPGFAAR